MTPRKDAMFLRLRDTGRTVADYRMDLRRRTVLDVFGQEVGRVTALIVDADVHKVRFLQVSFGGILRDGRKTTFIPVEAIAWISPTTVTIDRSGHTISRGPTYDPEFIDDVALFEQICGYYEVPVYWNSRDPKPASKPGRDGDT